MLLGRKIHVVGGGVAGLMSAVLLAGRGAQVTLFEKATALTEVGAGVQISPNGWRVITAAGLAGDLAGLSRVSEGVTLRNGEAGRDVAQLDPRASEPASESYFVHRADLIGVLRRAVQQLGVDIQLGQTCSGLDAEGRLRREGGAAEAADLIIGADGLHSTLRPAIGNQEAPFFTGQVAWRALVPNSVSHPDRAIVHMGAGRHLVSYPLRDGKTVNLVGVEERKEWAADGWHHEDHPEAFQAAFAGYDTMARDLLAGVETCYLWGLFRHDVATHWHGEAGRVALVGDAAHPTLPFLAQGANLALEDAWVLAGCLSQYETSQTAVKAYQIAREARVRRAIKMANGNAWKYHLPRGPIRWGAHLGLSAVSRLAPWALLKPFEWLYAHDVTQER